jgi:hypothetical protein
MREYPKIETAFERAVDFSITEKLKRPVFGSIATWLVTEKVDGTNIRIHLDADNCMTIGGRAAGTQLSADLITNIYRTITATMLEGLRRDQDRTTITLYGEGYGLGIQKGSGYRADKGFILFDVLIDGRWWLDENSITDIAQKLDIPRVPELGIMSIEEMFELVRDGFLSLIPGATCAAEGIVARTIEPLFDARGQRIMFKLKTKDFVGERR